VYLIVLSVGKDIMLSSRNNEVDRVWKEAAVSQFEVLFWDFLGGTDENYRKPAGTTGLQTKI
jgi:hypothetical protein